MAEDCWCALWMTESTQSCITNIHKRQQAFILLLAETYLNIFVRALVDKETLSGGFAQAG